MDIVVENPVGLQYIMLLWVRQSRSAMDFINTIISLASVLAMVLRGKSAIKNCRSVLPKRLLEPLKPEI